LWGMHVTDRILRIEWGVAMARIVLF